MTTRLSVNNLKFHIEREPDESYMASAIAKQLHVPVSDISDIEIRKRSIDARHKDDIRYVYSVDCDIREAERVLKRPGLRNVAVSNPLMYSLPDNDHIPTYAGRPVVIGAGPAGLFCAYIMIEAGLRPIIIERGPDVDRRRADVDEFWKSGILDPESNVQFGEGGAGAFSDGKLNTLVNDKAGRCRFVLETFVMFGAPVNILYDSKPHVGTDILIDVIRNMREYMSLHGAEFRFCSKVTDIVTHTGADMHITGVTVENPDGSYQIGSDRVILAIGHSARDTFKLLYDSGVAVSAKPFAVGLRVEHPRRFIDISQYGERGADLLPAAPYKLTSRTGSGRGVYSFCMCPGGYVVNASSEPGMLAVNGMSYSGRNGDNSNSAVIVTVTPDDYPSDHPLAGVEFQRDLERKAYEAGQGAIPVQRLGDFAYLCGEERFGEISGGTATELIRDPGHDFGPACKGKYLESDLTPILPMELNRCIIEGMMNFNKSIPGFAHPDIYLSGVESRTSSPVRIERDESGQSVSVRGLYPCGEGAGYAGGITSAAMDGIYIAEQVISSL
ncbi:MAG: FAD-dependent oxidoreductase [Lachnospiraceae bacterium]|nr:FAD-dependent oxidoreductase [Lachnospiraceae bacterium]